LSKLTLDWTSTAIADLKAIWDYIAIDNEAAADRTIDRIQSAAESLLQFPKAGRASSVRGSREFVVCPARRTSWFMRSRAISYKSTASFTVRGIGRRGAGALEAARATGQYRSK
jgi:plasmid stabilization system protein ParE